MGRKAIGPANQFSKKLNQELRAWMGRRGMTIQDLEEAAEVSRNRISLTLYKLDSPLNTNELDRICKALGVEPSTVVRDAEKALRVEQAAETSSMSDKELAAQILARAEAATKAGYALAAHPADDIVTEDSGWSA
ncbi:helix-turn-helix domain-containing protein [Rothia mucilaginosa]|uniref:helix-turn-helix domain-containing protein n=1 Tax=Rothia mucilaginosa TaxID=43675 RepID=UPI0028E9DF13|nr:helix-turn-helix transcriptional regulator [Rothia mucilaginosa]